MAAVCSAGSPPERRSCPVRLLAGRGWFPTRCRAKSQGITCGLNRPKKAGPETSNSKSRNLLDVHGLSPAFMRSGGIEKVARDWRKTSQEGKIT
jgi:hypothetical protein